MVDCLLITGAWGMVPGARAHGLGSREEHVELSGDLGGRPAIEVDCLLKRDSLLCLIGL